jgi:hypothetical protein
MIPRIASFFEPFASFAFSLSLSCFHAIVWITTRSFSSLFCLLLLLPLPLPYVKDKSVPTISFLTSLSQLFLPFFCSFSLFILALSTLRVPPSLVSLPLPPYFFDDSFSFFLFLVTLLMYECTYFFFYILLVFFSPAKDKKNPPD